MKKYILLLSALLLTLFVQAQTKKTRLNEKLGDVVLENKLPASFSYQLHYKTKKETSSSLKSTVQRLPAQGW